MKKAVGDVISFVPRYLKMRFAYQTIIYGPRINDWDRVLSVLRDAGYKGIELFQQTSSLTEICEEFLARLDRHGIELVGLATGSLRDRAEWLGDHRGPYLYLDSYNEETHKEMLEALEGGYRIAVHPHVFKSIHRLANAEGIFAKSDFAPYSEQLLLLPDTAHLTIANDKPMDAIRRYPRRLAGIHLKDWNAAYGRASHRYSQGFCALGEGDAGVETIIRAVLEARWLPADLWVVVEQDYANLPPEHTIQKAAQTLMDWQVYPRREFSLAPEDDLGTSHNLSGPKAERELELRRLLEAATNLTSPAAYHRHAVEALRKVTGARSVQLRSYLESREWLTLLAYSGTLRQPRPDYAKQIEPGLANGHLGDPKPRKTELGIWRLPVFNCFNLNHLRFVVDFDFGTDAEDPSSWLEPLGRILGTFLDHRLNEVCQRVSGRIPVIADVVDFEMYVRRLRDLIQFEIGCDAVAFFIADSSRSRIRAVASDEILQWRQELDRKSKRYYAYSDEGTTAEVWRTGFPQWLDTDVESPKAKVILRIDGDANGKVSLLMVPMLAATGDAVGTVRLGNKRAPDGTITQFSEDDLALVDAVLQMAIPRILVLQAEKRRLDQLQQLTHELKKPLVVIAGYVELLEREFEARRKRWNFPNLDYDWFADAASWCGLMRNLVRNPDYLTSDASKLAMNLERTSLLPDVVAPIVRSFESLLRSEGLPLKYPGVDGVGRYTIDQGDFGTIPQDLYVDRNMFQQIVFNLLDNAVKYSDPKRRDAFRIRIVVENRMTEYVIRVQDDGIGLDDFENTDELFDEGTRGPNAYRYDLAGTGFGLWIVRRLLALHGGSIRVSNRRAPTEFEIRLPAALGTRNWQSLIG